MSLQQITVSPFDKPYQSVGRFFKVVSAGDAIKVRFVFHDDSETETVMYEGLSIEHPREFKSFFLSSSDTQDVIIFASNAKLRDERRSETSISGTSNLDSSSAQVTANQVEPILPARLGRRSVLIQCDDVVYLGGANMDGTNGIKIDAGESMELGTLGAIYAFSATDQTLRILEEVN